MSANVTRRSDEAWEYFETEEFPPYRIKGKYLFFSEDRGLLVEVAVDELETNGFHRAKINPEGKQRGSEYVLCLYYKDDSRKRELADKYRNRDGLKYRYWKSDEDTRRGKYSEQFLQKLTPEERESWTRKRE